MKLRIKFLEDISEATPKGMIMSLPFGLAKPYIDAGKAVICESDVKEILQKQEEEAVKVDYEISQTFKPKKTKKK